MTERTLFPPGPATGNLTGRQQQALDLLTQNPNGLRSSDLGRQIHVAKGCPYCSPLVICRYAMSTGEEVGKALRKKDLAIKRRTGKWELMHPPRPPVDPDFDPFPPGF